MKILLNLIFCLILLFVFQKTLGHPGIGLAIDSKGNIYYTDLKQIWRLTPNGEKTIAVAAIHSHELYMDKNDNLFGEHLWYEPATEKFFHYHWCLKSNGELLRLTENLEAYTMPTSFSFVRDDNENMYWYEKESNGTFNFIKQDTLGNIHTLASGVFNDIRWLFSTPKGEIYFLDLDDLYKVKSKSEFQLISKNLSTGTLWTVFFGKQHSVFGVWFDKVGNIYTAVAEDKCIKQITPTGQVLVVYKSDNGSPVNGLFDSNGELWVLDGHEVKKIQLTEINKYKVWFSNNMKYLIGLFGLMLTTFVLVKMRRK